MTDSKFMLIGIAVAGIGLYILVKKAAGIGQGAFDAVADVAHNLSPFNANNYVHQGSDALYEYLSGDSGIYGAGGDPLMQYQSAPLNVPGTPTYNNALPATNSAGYKMNLGDAAIAQVATFRWPWES